jgi:MATE family multidrug resistance protein
LVLGWGVEPWGVPGAAWATVIAQWCRAAIYAWLVLLPSNRRAFNTADCLPNLTLLRRMIRFGGPSGVQMMLDVMGFSVFVLIVGELGVTESIATNSTFRLSQLAFMPVWGLGMATAVLVGQKLGEDRPDLAQRAARTTLGMSLTYMVGLSLLFILIPRVLLEGIYFLSHEAPAEAAVQASAEVESLTVELMRFVSAYNIFDAAVIILVSVLRGAGDTRFVMFTSSIMATMLGVGSYFGVNYYGVDIYGAWWFLSAWIFGLGIVYTARYRTGKWKEMRVIDQVHHVHGAHAPAPHDRTEPELQPNA